MPVFDFICLSCQEEFTELILGGEEIRCPHCGKTKLKKLISGFNTISEATHYETNAKDLPSMEQWAKTKHTLRQAQGTKSTKKKTREKVQRLKMKDLKPRAAVHKRSK